MRLPGELWEVRFGPTYRHKFDNGWIAGLNFAVGSASDQPFASLDEITARGTAFLRVPHGERNAWFFTLNYTNYSDFLGGLPIPGIDYVHSPSDRFTLVLGFPFNSMEWRPTDKLGTRGSVRRRLPAVVPTRAAPAGCAFLVVDAPDDSQEYGPVGTVRQPQ